MTKPRLIALCSPVMGSGKTEVAKRLVTHHGYIPVKFAGPIKAMARALFQYSGFTDRDIARLTDGDLKESELLGDEWGGGVTPRRIMQTLGTEWGRDMLHENYWAALAMGMVAYAHQQNLPVVIDDMRFTNEMDAVTDRGGLLVRVVRPDAPKYAAHRSEGELDGIAMHELHNAGTIAHLHALADTLAKGELCRG